MARYFNTTGPCMPHLHYMLPPADRRPEYRAKPRGERLGWEQCATPAGQPVTVVWC